MRKDEQIIREGLDQIGIASTDFQISQLQEFLSLLFKWNKVYNLTSIKDREEALYKHLLDSATLVPVLKNLFDAKNPRGLDVGCGGGLPGIPCAILLPGFQFELIDTVAKKISFVRQSIITLKLSNVQAHNQRVENFEDRDRFDFIVSRAFSSIENFVVLTEPLLKENGRWIIMKGKLPSEEMEYLPNHIAVESIEKVNIPSFETERHIITLRRI